MMFIFAIEAKEKFGRLKGGSGLLVDDAGRFEKRRILNLNVCVFTLQHCEKKTSPLSLTPD